MPSTANLNKRYFPSYGQIQQRILNQQKKKHEQKIYDLQRKISALNQAFNLQEQHKQIKNKLLQNYRSSNHECMKSIMDSLNDNEQKLQKQKDSNEWNQVPTSSNGNTTSNAFSLNYCIDEDMEEDNHYQNHLKFKKQVLQRDLFQNLHYKNDRKKYRDQQYIFKNLYNSRPNTVQDFVSSDKLKSRKPVKNNYIQSDNSKEFKENVHQLKKKPSYYSTSKIALPSHIQTTTNSKNYKNSQNNSSLKKCARKQPHQDQFLQQNEVCQKNTKILKDSYGKYLKELEGTNIIKWRILGGQKDKQRDSINQSFNITGAGNKNNTLERYGNLKMSVQI